MLSLKVTYSNVLKFLNTLGSASAVAPSSPIPVHLYLFQSRLNKKCIGRKKHTWIRTVFYLLSAHDVLSAHPLLWPKVMWEDIYTLPTLYRRTAPCTYCTQRQQQQASRWQLFHMMALRKANFGIPAETVSYVCQSLFAVLQQASLFLEICRHMALPDQDHSVIYQ